MLGLLMLGIWGCGGRSERMEPKPPPPARAGSVEQLENTRWGTPGGQLAFYPGYQASFTPGGDGAPLLGTYTLAEGIATVTVPGVEPFHATWDGTRLVLGGKEACTPLGAPDETVGPRGIGTPRPLQ